MWRFHIEELGAGDWEMEIEDYYAHTACTFSDLIESAATVEHLAISFAAFLAQQFSLRPQVQIPPSQPLCKALQSPGLRSFTPGHAEPEIG
jgi:hypothetical protein